MNSNNTSNKSTESPVGFRSDLNRNELTTRDELMINLAHFAMDHAKIIYYYHGTREWRSIYLNDDIVYRNEMKILARGYREGEISVICKDTTIRIGGKKYHPLLLQITGVSCVHWSVLKEDWWTDHMHWTPYLFRSKELRDLCYEYIAKRRIPQVDWWTEQHNRHHYL